MTKTTEAIKNKPPRISKFDQQIGKNIRMLRQYQNMTQVDLAKEMGISHQQLNKYEHCKNRISASRLLTIAKVLGVDIALMYEEQAVGRRSNAYSKLFEYLAKIECSSQLQEELYDLIEEIAFLELPGRGLSPRKINAISASTEISKEDCGL